MGGGTIFHIPPLVPIITPSELLTYGVFAFVCAAIGSLYIRFFYGMRDHFFRKIHLSKPLKPALGGFMVGSLAFFLPQVLGGGYEWVQSAMDGNLTTGLMAMLGPLWAGAVYDALTPSAPFWMGAIILGIACLLLAPVRAPVRERAEPGAQSQPECC
jgi:H+/Cl- antiporter ClcA